MLKKKRENQVQPLSFFFFFFSYMELLIQYFNYLNSLNKELLLFIALNIPETSKWDVIQLLMNSAGLMTGILFHT